MTEAPKIASVDSRQEPGEPSPRWLFGKFLASYGAIWIAILIGFIGCSYPLMRRFTTDQLESRLRAEAALSEEYLSAVGAASDAYKPQLEQVCHKLAEPGILDAHVTVFSRKAEALADSRIENPLAIRALGRPEVQSALRRKVGTTIRYSQMDRCRMVFVAYPHVHLGEVADVIRIGVPYSSIDGALWLLYLKIGLSGMGLAVSAAALSALYWTYRRSEGRT